MSEWLGDLSVLVTPSSGAQVKKRTTELSWRESSTPSVEQDTVFPWMTEAPKRGGTDLLVLLQRGVTNPSDLATFLRKRGCGGGVVFLEEHLCLLDDPFHVTVASWRSIFCFSS